MELTLQQMHVSAFSLSPSPRTRYHLIMVQSIPKGKPGPTVEGYLQGQFLIAMPTMGDPRFERALVYICSHSEEGAMGLIVNKSAPGITFNGLLAQVGIDPVAGTAKDKEKNKNLSPLLEAEERPILFGGPVEPGRGFVLHSQDYLSKDSSLAVSPDVAMTATVDILRAIVRGTGPSRSIVALGYAGWGPGQLEMEIQENGWLICDMNEELLYGADVETKYERALATLGVDLSLLSGDAGHA